MNQDLVGALRLSDWGLIRASGADARSFLHGQLTQDVLHLQPGQARLAAFCSAKGRMLASFVIWPQGDDLLLACSADVLPAALRRLSMFVLRAKCKLTDASGEFALWGVAQAGGQPSAGLPWPTAPGLVQAEGGTTVVRLPDAATADGPVERALVLPAASADAVPSLPALDAARWRWLEARSGTPRIVAATVEQFVPQMVNLELVGGVNFQKGCYPGQEVVARSQYRGTLKRRGFLVRADAALAPGDEVFHSSDAEQPAGLVVVSGERNADVAALVSLKIDATQDGELFAKSPGGVALHLEALPYALPTEAA